MKKAIYHLATRVIISLTVDPSPSLDPTLAVRDVADDFTISGGPWKFDESFNKTPATAQEDKNARTDPDILALRTRLLTMKQTLLAYKAARQGGSITNAATLLPYLDGILQNLADSLEAIYNTIKGQ